MSQKTIILVQHPLACDLIVIAVGTIYSLGVWTVKPGKESEFIRAWNDFARWTRDTQDGAKDAVLLQDIANPQKFVSFGPWRDLKNTEAWRKTQEFRNAFARFKDLCSDIQPNTLKCVVSIGE